MVGPHRRHRPATRGSRVGRAILATLDAFGLSPDGPVMYQSARGAAYEAAFDA
jgi:glutamyl/glutaminyl-tRNA synthetase